MKTRLINYYFDSYEEYKAYKPYLKGVLGAILVPIGITIINILNLI